MAATTLTFADGTTRTLSPGEAVYPLARVADGAWCVGAAWCLPGVACVTPGGRVEGVASADAWPPLPGPIAAAVRFGGWDHGPTLAPFTPPPWAERLYGAAELTRLRVVTLAAWGRVDGARVAWAFGLPAPCAPVEAGAAGAFGVGLAAGDVVACRASADGWAVAVVR